LVRIWVEELLFDEYLLPFWLSLLLVIYQLWFQMNEFGKDGNIILEQVSDVYLDNKSSIWSWRLKFWFRSGCVEHHTMIKLTLIPSNPKKLIIFVLFCIIRVCDSATRGCLPQLQYWQLRLLEVDSHLMKFGRWGVLW
jgi:hypothetical protein